MLYPRLTHEGQPIPKDALVRPEEHLMTQRRIICLEGEMTGDPTAINTLMSLGSMSKDPIKMTISSPGGSLDAAFLLYDTMKLSPAPIWTLGRWVCSAAVIALAGAHRRYLLPHSRVMLHLPQTAMSGDPKEISIMQAEFEKYKEEMLDLYIACGAKKKKSKILADIDRALWMGPEETIAYGLADEIISQAEWNSWLGVKED